MHRPDLAARSNAGRLLTTSIVLAFGALAGLGADRTHLYAFTAVGLLAGFLMVLRWYVGRVSTAEVVGWAIVFRLLVFWWPPGLSDDAYRYVWDGMIQHEGINPYRYVPADPALSHLAGEPVFDQLNSAQFYSIYPPVSQLLFFVGGLAYGPGWEVSYYLIKGLLALMEGTALLLMARLMDARRLLLYAWNPLVVVETAGQAHTEAALVLFLVLTLWLIRRGRPGLAGAALAGAVWVKFYPVLLFPFLWRRFRWRAAWPALAASVVLLLPYARTYVPAHLAASLNLYVRYFEFNAGLYYALKQVGLLLTGLDLSKIIGPLFQVLMLAGVAWLYVLDGRHRLDLRRTFVLVIGLFFVLATTVHPWYLLGLLALVAGVRPPAWHWIWLSVLSIGTYLRYVDGPYGTFVALGWAGFAVLGVVRYEERVLQWIQRARARRKVRIIRDWLPGGAARVLDLGAAEGYVGEEVARQTGAAVMLADVIPMNRTRLPHVRYDGYTLPFETNAFDATVLYFVLHHCEDPVRVLAEARRVTDGDLIVAESVYVHRWDRLVLEVLDRAANRWRSRGLMRAQEEVLHFRTAAAWRALFTEQGLTVVEARRRGRWFHRQALFRLRRADGSVIANQKRRNQVS